MYRTLFPSTLFADLDRLQQEVQQIFERSPSIRGIGRGGFPALNIGGTDAAVEVYAFAPGVDPASLEVNIERGVLTITGERKPSVNGAGASGEKTQLHINERFSGRFRRVVSLPDDIDASAVTAAMKDGVLRVTIQRRAAAQPRRIEVR